MAVGVGGESLCGLPATIKQKKNEEEEDHNTCRGKSRSVDYYK